MQKYETRKAICAFGCVILFLLFVSATSTPNL